MPLQGQPASVTYLPLRCAYPQRTRVGAWRLASRPALLVPAAFFRLPYGRRRKLLGRAGRLEMQNVALALAAFPEVSAKGRASAACPPQRCTLWQPRLALAWGAGASARVASLGRIPAVALRPTVAFAGMAAALQRGRTALVRGLRLPGDHLPPLLAVWQLPREDGTFLQPSPVRTWPWVPLLRQQA